MRTVPNDSLLAVHVSCRNDSISPYYSGIRTIVLLITMILDELELQYNCYSTNRLAGYCENKEVCR
jgi:hypothetical protein